MIAGTSVADLHGVFVHGWIIALIGHVPKLLRHVLRRDAASEFIAIGSDGEPLFYCHLPALAASSITFATAAACEM